MNPCQYAAAVTALACAIYQNTSSEEAALLASAFSQLGDAIETMAAKEALCSQTNNS